MPRSRLWWDAAASVAENAGARLPELAEALFRDGRKAARQGAPTAALHRFRLDVKAFRYTLESFRPCYGPGLERRIAGLRRLQDGLGAIEDCAAAWRLVDAILRAGDPARESVKVKLEERRRRMASQFRRFWRTGFDAPGEERRWRQYLSRPRSQG